MQALELKIIDAGKSFGDFRALDQVSMTVKAGTIHALLGENGAGKSTLVKGLVGYSPLDQGILLADDREVEIRNPKLPNALGIGMVYQHFTLAPSLTVAENLLLARGNMPWRIHWRLEREVLQEFMRSMPFRLDLERVISSLSAGEKQKLEILKQLYLRRRLLILDEPTSVLTPGEADEVLALMRDMTRRGDLTVLMITHKFREVMAYADDVTVLRKGRLVGGSAVAATDEAQMAHWMMGQAREEQKAAPRAPVAADAAIGLAVTGLRVRNDRGVDAVGGSTGLALSVRRGEIVGLAGISGNGQKEFAEALLGQRRIVAGNVDVDGAPYHASRAQMHERKVFALPEEPLRNASVAGMSVAENMALRNFDRAPIKRQGWRLGRRQMRKQALALIEAFNVRPPLPDRPIGTLSGGNVQRAILARELGDALLPEDAVHVLIAANPVFGLDFASVAAIHARLLQARASGAAVLLISEDLDELLELSDRIVVMTDGMIVHETSAAGADRAHLGRWMAGHESHESANETEMEPA